MKMKRWGIPAAAALIAAAASLYFYAELPETMAVHFGPKDEPDRYASKTVGAFLLPLIILLIPAITNLSSKLEPNEAKRVRFAEFNETLNVVIVLLLLAVHFLVLGFNLGYDVNVSFFTPFAVGAMFIAVGNVVPRAPQSGWRLKWMKEEHYARYTRFQGRFMVAAGFLILPSALLPGDFGVYAVFLIIAALHVSVIGGAVYYGRR